jgi:hypothetical protein
VQAQPPKPVASKTATTKDQAPALEACGLPRTSSCCETSLSLFERLRTSFEATDRPGGTPRRSRRSSLPAPWQPQLDRTPAQQTHQLRSCTPLRRNSPPTAKELPVGSVATSAIGLTCSRPANFEAADCSEGTPRRLRRCYLPASKQTPTGSEDTPRKLHKLPPKQLLPASRGG